jgi:hypothetical protein
VGTPPQVLFVPLARTHWSRVRNEMRRSREPVHLPGGAFDASALFVNPHGGAAGAPGGGAYYRVFAAVYHEGPTANSGHYWSIVRGAVGTHALADDARVETLRDETIAVRELPHAKRYGSATSARRVVLVGLERVAAGPACPCGVGALRRWCPVLLVGPCGVGALRRWGPAVSWGTPPLRDVAAGAACTPSEARNHRIRVTHLS